MPASLEDVGQQPGGAVLREFLSKGHNDDGTIKAGSGVGASAVADLLPSLSAKQMVDAAVMTTPPTVAAGGTTTAIAGGVYISPIDSRLRWVGGVPEVTTVGTDRGNTYTKKKQAKAVQTAGTQTDNVPFFIEFVFEGTAFELVTKNFNTMVFRVWVNEQPHAATPVSPPAGGTNDYFAVTFASRARRRIVLEFSGTSTSQFFGGLIIGPTDSIAPAPAASSGRLIFVGDSFVMGAANSIYANSFVWRAGRLLGLDDVWGQGQSGTGFINTNVPSSLANYGQRVAADLYPYSPDIVVFNGSTNDDSLAAGLVQAEVTRLLSEVRSALPNAIVICTGVLMLGTLNAARVTNNNEVRAGALAVPGVTFIDAQSPVVWSSGAGKVGGTTGTGSADFYVAADGLHPSDAGHVFLGDRIASAIAQTAKIAVR